MQEKTDLDGVKKMAKVLLYTDIHKTKLSPVIVSHFFTSTGIADIGKNGKIELVDITANEESLRKWQRKTSAYIDKAKDAQEIFYMINNPYRLAFLKFTKDYLSREDFSSLLSSGWISAENPHQDPNVSKMEFVQMFKEADRMVLMDEDERTIFESLDDRVTIYRGVTSYNEKNVKALSWTLSAEKAEWFATRFGEEGTVYKAEIDKSHILAYFSGRGEAEIGFPCKDSVLEEKLKGIGAQGKKEHYVDELYDGDKSLLLLRHRFENLDEVNYLAKRLDSFGDEELRSFYAVVSLNKNLTVADLINQTFNMPRVTLIENVSNLEAVGKRHYMSMNGCVIGGPDNQSKEDYIKIGKELLESGKGIATQYGLMFHNEEIKEEIVYNGKTFPPYYYSGDTVIGTGKTTLMNHISNLMGNRKKLFLTKTKTALKNLQRRIDMAGTQSKFVSLDSFTRKVELDEYDVIFVDECSTIDNRTMVRFLGKIRQDTLLVLAGDIYQIESIDFGNWFYYAKNLIKKRSANVELLSTWRTQDASLIQLWKEVREKEIYMTEILSYEKLFSRELGEDILKEDDNDEVVLCLNYDGKFGLNNINKYFQNKNTKGKSVNWQEWTYKVGDKILFNDTKRFPILYNNLKGKIINIEKETNKIAFTVEVETILTDSDCRGNDIQFLQARNGKTQIKFYVYEYTDDKEEEGERQIKSVIPFQLAYAVSIHKAQGLEYESVKVVIPDANAEKITHGVFYTAITRAKKKLKIYWDSETMNKILNGFKDEMKADRSLEIIKRKL